MKELEIQKKVNEWDEPEDLGAGHESRGHSDEEAAEQKVEEETPEQPAVVIEVQGDVPSDLSEDEEGLSDLSDGSDISDDEEEEPVRRLHPLFLLALLGQHRGAEAADAPLGRHLALQLVPQALEVAGGGQLLAATQPVEQIAARAELGAGQ